MRFRQKSLEEIRDTLGRLGLKRCLICESENLNFDLRPAIVRVGGFDHDEEDPLHDPEANVVFAARVECSACGHMLFFDAERHRGPNEKMFVTGLSLEEEAVLEAEEGG